MNPSTLDAYQEFFAQIEELKALQKAKQNELLQYEDTVKEKKLKLATMHDQHVEGRMVLVKNKLHHFKQEENVANCQKKLSLIKQEYEKLRSNKIQLENAILANSETENKLRKAIDKIRKKHDNQKMVVREWEMNCPLSLEAKQLDQSIYELSEKIKNHESRHDAYQNRKNELRNAINQVNESNIGLTYQPKEVQDLQMVLNKKKEEYRRKIIEVSTELAEMLSTNESLQMKAGELESQFQLY